MSAAFGDLRRFEQAQDHDGTFERALAEFRAGRKVSHWMWFVFPQLAGLGQSEMSRRYAIASLDEAVEYLADPVLGPRLRAGCEALLGAAGDAAEIMGPIDAVKLRSSATLFLRAAADSEDADLFAAVLARFFDADPDPETDRLLAEE